MASQWVGQAYSFYAALGDNDRAVHLPIPSVQIIVDSTPPGTIMIDAKASGYTFMTNIQNPNPEGLAAGQYVFELEFDPDSPPTSADVEEVAPADWRYFEYDPDDTLDASPYNTYSRWISEDGDEVFSGRLISGYEDYPDRNHWWIRTFIPDDGDLDIRRHARLYSDGDLVAISNNKCTGAAMINGYVVEIDWDGTVRAWSPSNKNEVYTAQVNFPAWVDLSTISIVPELAGNVRAGYWRFSRDGKRAVCGYSSDVNAMYGNASQLSNEPQGFVEVEIAIEPLPQYGIEVTVTTIKEYQSVFFMAADYDYTYPTSDLIVLYVNTSGYHTEAGKDVNVDAGLLLYDLSYVVFSFDRLINLMSVPGSFIVPYRASSGQSPDLSQAYLSSANITGMDLRYGIMLVTHFYEHSFSTGSKLTIPAQYDASSIYYSTLLYVNYEVYQYVPPHEDPDNPPLPEFAWKETQVGALQTISDEIDATIAYYANGNNWEVVNQAYGFPGINSTSLDGANLFMAAVHPDMSSGNMTFALMYTFNWFGSTGYDDPTYYALMDNYYFDFLVVDGQMISTSFHLDLLDLGKPGGILYPEGDENKNYPSMYSFFVGLSLPPPAN